METSHHKYLSISSLPAYTKKKNATATNFLKIHILFTSHSCALTHGPPRLSCAFLANYMAKCQTSSGPYWPIFCGGMPGSREVFYHAYVGLNSLCLSDTTYLSMIHSISIVKVSWKLSHLGKLSNLPHVVSWNGKITLFLPTCTHCVCTVSKAFSV